MRGTDWVLCDLTKGHEGTDWFGLEDCVRGH